MSHAMGAALFPDGVIFWGEYDGTCDVMCSNLFDTAAEVDAQWRAQVWRGCTCGRPLETIRLASCYGGGLSYTAHGCRHCRTVVSLPADDDREYEDYLPDWWPGESGAIHRRAPLHLRTLTQRTNAPGHLRTRK